jgi:D-aminopeptidase
VARRGGFGFNSSGDIFLAFSTCSPQRDKNTGIKTWTVLPKDDLDALYKGTATATEEAIINTLVAAGTMTGINGNTIFALPHDRLKAVLGPALRARPAE